LRRERGSEEERGELRSKGEKALAQRGEEEKDVMVKRKADDVT
jgi:hypothetical protein